MAKPIKFNPKIETFPILLLLLTSIASIYFYSVFPEQVPTHWNFAGEVDDYSSKAVGAFLIPGIMVLMYGLFWVLPYLDPKKERYAQFAKVYHVFKFLFIFYFALIYLIASLAALDYPVRVGTWIPVMVGSLFLIIGNYLGKIKMNWFVGIKTPWTLSSENVWNQTHRLGGKLFILAGVVMALMPMINNSYRLPLFIVAIVAAALVPMIYSYYLFYKENKQKHENN